MSNNNSFGGKLKKVLASMCSLFVGASGVSQASKPVTSISTDPKLDKYANVFGADAGWRLESKVGDAKKENSWLDRGGNRWQRVGKVHGVNVDVGFACNALLCNFTIWVDNETVLELYIPGGILFDVMRHFECEYFSNNAELQDNGTRLSCAVGNLDENTEDEVFLRFILWAFCGADDAINPKSGSNVQDLKDGIFELAVKEGDFDEGKFTEKDVVVEQNGEMESKGYGVLKSGYFLKNFSTRVREVYKKAFGYNLADIDDVVDFIAQLNNKNEALKNQKHTSKYLLSVLGAFVGGGALVEGAHHFPGAKRSGSSEVNEGKPSINKVNKGKTSSNKKGEQKAKKNLKKQKS